MPDEPQDISASELAVLQLLWRRPPLSIRQVAETLHGDRAAARYPTVQKQLERLEAKGFVRRDRSLMVHLFSAAVGREELVGRKLDAVVDTLCGGSLSPVLTHLLRAAKLSDAQRDELRALIERIGDNSSEADEQGDDSSNDDRGRPGGDGGDGGKGKRTGKGDRSQG